MNSIFSDSARKEQIDWVEKDLKDAQEAVHGRLLAQSSIQLRVARQRRDGSLRCGRFSTTTAWISCSTATITTTSDLRP